MKWSRGSGCTGTANPNPTALYRTVTPTPFRLRSPAKGVDALVDARRAIREFEGWKDQFKAENRSISPVEKEETRRLRKLAREAEADAANAPLEVPKADPNAEGEGGDESDESKKGLSKVEF